LQGKVALITGADSGIGRAVAIAYAREGADVAIAYLDEHDDANETKRWVEAAGRTALLLPGDITNREHCRALVQTTVERFGRIDVLVNNAAYQMTFESIEEISDDEWHKTFSTNVGAMFRITKAAVPPMPAGSSIVKTSSVNADSPSPAFLA
jgi:NAD(P)-dependent dehydrogenase (short-subunit alcohol dehydrogenase family)